MQAWIMPILDNKPRCRLLPQRSIQDLESNHRLLLHADDRQP